MSAETLHPDARLAPARGLGRRGVAGRRPFLGRPRLRTLLWIVLGGAAAYVLLPEAGSLAASLRSIAGVGPGWILAGLALVAFRYAMAAVSLQVVVNGAIPFVPTLLVQLASSFVGRLTPEGIGWLVLNQRYLERSGIPRSSGLAAIGLKFLAGGLMRFLIAVLVAIGAGAEGLVAIDIAAPSPMMAAGAAVAIAAAFALVWIFRERAGRMLVPVVAASRDLAVVLRDPRRALVLLGSTAALTIVYGLLLAVAVAAFGADVRLVPIFAVYLGATAVASLSPTPGNLGAIEIALTAGLTAIGVASSAAVAAVLLFRLLTFWLPVLPGFLAFRYLQRRDLL